MSDFINIETSLEKNPIYKINENVIRYKNNIFKRLFHGLPKYTYIKFTGRIEFEPVDIKIKNEIDIKEWYAKTLRGIFNYKNNLRIKDKNNNYYKFFGCFPIKILNNHEIKISYDYFLIEGEE